jgi:hypothetical protein
LTEELKACTGEKTVSSTEGAGKTGYPPCRRLKLDLSLSPWALINSKWIKDLNIRYEATTGKIRENAGTHGHR